MIQPILLVDNTDLLWLREIHLSKAQAVPPTITAAIIYGKQEAPHRIDIFTTINPTILDKTIVYNYHSTTDTFIRAAVVCVGCEDNRRNNGFGPPHNASPNCQSGKYSHCSCDVCF